MSSNRSQYAQKAHTVIFQGGSAYAEELAAEIQALVKAHARYEGALRHLAETACIQRDWQFARAVLQGAELLEAKRDQAD